MRRARAAALALSLSLGGCLGPNFLGGSPRAESHTGCCRCPRAIYQPFSQSAPQAVRVVGVGD